MNFLLLLILFFVKINCLFNNLFQNYNLDLSSNTDTEYDFKQNQIEINHELI